MFTILVIENFSGFKRNGSVNQFFKPVLIKKIIKKIKTETAVLV